MRLLIRGDARRLPLADQSVQCVVTSPPYFGLRDDLTYQKLAKERTAQRGLPLEFAAV